MAVAAANEAVTQRFVLGRGRERAEQPVIDDQHAAVITVEAARIGRMMDAVMLGRIEHPFKRPEPADQLGMDEKLISEVDPEYRPQRRRVETEPNQRQEE